MAFAKWKLNWRAAAWATAIAGTGLILLVIPRHIWPPNGQLDFRPMMFEFPGMSLLAPGIVATSLARGAAWILMHPVTAFHFLTAKREGDQAMGFFVAASPAWSVVITWAFYYFVASRIYASRVRRPPSASAQTTLT